MNNTENMITDEPTVNRKSSRDGEGKIVRLFFAYLIFFFSRSVPPAFVLLVAKEQLFQLCIHARQPTALTVLAIHWPLES